MKMGPDWGTAQIKKPIAERHPLLVWYEKLCHFQKHHSAGRGKISTAPATGAVAAYLHMAYAIYGLDHNAELQEKLLARLRNPNTFWGARYEVHVAAIFARAGFTIEIEDEDDRSTSHCEFTATHKRTGKAFSVEAKRREGTEGSTQVRIGRLFRRALSKHANHPRIIFIDINVPSLVDGQQFPPFLDGALRRLRRTEAEGSSSSLALPPAYVFVTNTPWEHFLDAPVPPSAALIEGFRIPDFKGGVQATLREAINAREKHIEMHELMRSLEEHSKIPSTFDGEMPQYAFGAATERIRIGGRYMVPDAHGTERAAEVTTAVVVEAQRHALCGVTYDDGTSALCTMPLSDDELEAWREHPETFFGTIGQRRKSQSGPLEMYDFFHESCRTASKEKLLDAMKGSADLENLSALTQAELASIHAERLTYGALAVSKPRA